MAGGWSWKRTLLGPWPPAPAPVEEVRRREPLGGCWDVEGTVVAWAKSSAREGSLGCVVVDEVDGLEKPWNCEVRSSYCFCREGRASAMLSAFLFGRGKSC